MEGFVHVDCPEDPLQNTVAQAGPKLAKNVQKALSRYDLIRDSHQRCLARAVTGAALSQHLKKNRTTKCVETQSSVHDLDETG